MAMPLPVEDAPQVVAGIKAATNATPVAIETTDAHGLKDGDEIKIRDVTGNDAANGSFFARVKDPKTIELFSDTGLTNAVAGTGAFQSGGVMLRPLPADYGIIVGINGYVKFKPLNGPESDAKRFHNWLTSPTGGCVSIGKTDLILSDLSNLASVQPTIEAVNKAFRKYSDPAYEKDDHRLGRRLYVFLSGHGITPVLTQNAKTDIAGLLMADSSPSYPQHVVGQLYAEWFRNAGAFDELALFMDCCRDLKPNVSPVGPVTPPVNSDRADKIRFLYAMAAEVDSKAWEVLLPIRGLGGDQRSPQEPRGVFSYALMEALNTPTVCDDQGQLTSNVLGEYLTRRVNKIRKDQAAKVVTSQFLNPIVFLTGRNTRPTLRVAFNPALEGKTIVLSRDSDVIDRYTIVELSWSKPVQKGIYVLAIEGVKQTEPKKIDGTEEIFDVDDFK
jgi:hypothetical protein